MSHAYQRTQQQRRQQQVVHHEPELTVLPSRSTTDAPDYDERYAQAGNGERVSMAELEGGGEGQALAEPPPGAGMDALREHVAAEAASDPFAVTPADLAGGFASAEQGLLAGADGCTEVMEGFEEASRRWYHFGRGQDDYERERPLYEADLHEHQRLALRVRHDGLRVEMSARVADEALREARAAMLLFEALGIARPDASGSLALDPVAIDLRLEAAREAFASTGYRPGQESAEDGLSGDAKAAVDALMVQAHGLGFVLSSVRAEAKARELEAAEQEKERLQAIVRTCDDIGGALSTVTAGVALAQAGALPAAGAELETNATEVGEPSSLVGVVGRILTADDLHAAAARLEALGAAREGWNELAHAEQVQDALGEYREAMQRVSEHGEAAQAQRDDYVAELGNLGRTMDLHAMLRGQPGAQQRDTGEAMEALARVRATCLSLEGARETLASTNQRLGESASVMGAFTRGRPGQAELIRLRQEQGGVRDYYLSVRQGLDARADEVAKQEEALAWASEGFSVVMGGAA